MRTNLFIGTHLIVAEAGIAADFPQGIGPRYLIVVDRISAHLDWWPRIWLDRVEGETYVSGPLWLPLVIFAGAAGALWMPMIRQSRRGRAGRCVSCGYDRRSLAAEAKCPECGTLPHSGHAALVARPWRG